jgi:hypothetical protein
VTRTLASLAFAVALTAAGAGMGAVLAFGWLVNGFEKRLM